MGGGQAGRNHHTYGAGLVQPVDPQNQLASASFDRRFWTSDHLWLINCWQKSASPMGEVSLVDIADTRMFKTKEKNNGPTGSPC